MRSRRFRLLRVGVALAIISATLATATTQAGADSDVSLSGLTTVAHIEVDDSHVFITSGTGSTSIAVRDYSGSAVANITNEAGADGMALSPDGTTLYVALSSADAVSVIDTATLTETTRYATGASTCPHAVGLAAGKLWISYGCTAGSSHIGSIDPSTGPATVTLGLSSWYYPPLLATSPGNTDLLVAGEPGISPSSATIYDVSSGTPVTVASNSNLGGNLGDIEVSPDGTKLYVSDGGVYHQQVYSTADFSSVTTYSTGGPYPTAVALSADGTVLATGRNGSPDVYLYKVGGSTAYRSRTFDDANNGYPYSVVQGGMAFSPDGSELFALSKAFTGSPVLHIISEPEKTPSSISLGAPPTATRGAGLTISGNLSVFEGTATGTQNLAIAKHDLAGVHTLAGVVTSSTGSFSFGDTPTVGGPNTYTVSWGGDSGHLATSSQVTVNVSRLATKISITTSAGTIKYAHAVTVTAHLGDTYNSRVVTIYAQPKGRAKKAIKAGKVDSHGNIHAVAHPSRNTTFTAVFGGDYHRAPASSAHGVRTRAAVAGTLRGWYATSGGVRVYHHKANPTVDAHVSPSDKDGENLCFPLQVKSGGAWRTVVRKCFGMDTRGAVSIYVYGSNTVGIPYRIRVQFAGDSANAANASGWYSFVFTT